VVRTNPGGCCEPLDDWLMDRILEKKRWSPTKLALLGGGTLVVLLFLVVLLSGGGGARLNVRADRLTISEVTQGLFLDYIPANGTVLPLQTVYLDAVEGGQVDTVFVVEGEFLEVDQPIIRLSNTNLLLDIMYREAEQYQQINNLRNTRLAMAQNSLSLRAQLLELDNQIAEAKRQYDQGAELYSNNLLSEMEYARKRDAYDYLRKRRELTLENHRTDSLFRSIQIEQIEASVQRMQNNLDAVKNRLERLTIRAPIAGQLTQLNGEVGQSMSTGQRIGQIDRLDGFKVRISIDEHYIARILPGLTGQFEFAGHTYNLVIDKVYPQVAGGRFDVDMLFSSETPEGIRRGQTLRVRLELGGASEAVLLPVGGFYSSSGGRYVYVVSEDGGQAEKRTIQIGRQNPRDYEILSGLTPGERVITSSYDAFGDAEKLNLK